MRDWTSIVVNDKTTKHLTLLSLWNKQFWAHVPMSYTKTGLRMWDLEKESKLWKGILGLIVYLEESELELLNLRLLCGDRDLDGDLRLRGGEGDRLNDL